MAVKESTEDKTLEPINWIPTDSVPRGPEGERERLGGKRLSRRRMPRHADDARNTIGGGAENMGPGRGWRCSELGEGDVILPEFISCRLQQSIITH